MYLKLIPLKITLEDQYDLINGWDTGNQEAEWSLINSKSRDDFGHKEGCSERFPVGIP